jgi:beta-lactamase class A
MAAGLSGLGTKKKTRRLPIIPILSLLLLVGAGAVFTYELMRFTQRADQIAADVTVAGVQVGGLAPPQAITRWEQAYAQPVVLYYADSPILLDPASVGFRTNSDTMVAAARSAIEKEADYWSRFVTYLTGQQSQQTVNVPLDADYQQNLLEQFLNDVAARYDRPPGTPSYDVNTLTFRPGAQGYILDVEKALPLVDAALHDPIHRTVVLPVSDSDASKPNIDTLREMVVAYLDAQGFIYDGQTTVASVFIMDLETGEEVNLLGDVAFSAASTVKVSILIDYFRHLLFEPTQDEAWLMANSLLCSNNASSNLLMQITGERVTGVSEDLFAGIADVTATAQELGARNSYISAPLVIGTAGQEFGSIAVPQTSPNAFYNTDADTYNQTTTEDLGTEFAMIYDCAQSGSGLMAAFPEEYTQQECRQMLELMSANDLQRLLQGGIPPGTRISHKNGWIDNEHGDAGIVYPPNGHNYVIAVFVWEDVDFMSYEKAWPLIEGVSRAAWNYFSPETPLIAPRTDLPPTAQECQGNFLPPDPEHVDLNDINGWRRDALQSQAPQPIQDLQSGG